MGVPTPALYRYAAERDYDKIPLRVATHPLDVYWSDRYGSTALHLLCQDRTTTAIRRHLAAVDAILAQAPEVVAWANVATWSPLHFAAERRWLVTKTTTVADDTTTTNTAASMDGNDTATVTSLTPSSTSSSEQNGPWTRVILATPAM